MAANNEFAGEVERLYKAEEVMLEQQESLATQIKQLSKQSQVVTNIEEKSSLELQIQQLKRSLENAKSENDKLKKEKQILEYNHSSSQHQQVTFRGSSKKIES